MLQSAKDWAYVINLGANLTTSKQTEGFPMYRPFTIRHDVGCWTSTCVSPCFGVCHPKLHDSPWLWRGVCNGAWLFPFWVTCLSFHLFATPPPPSFFPSPHFPRIIHSCTMLIIALWPLCKGPPNVQAPFNNLHSTLILRNVENPTGRITNEKQMCGVVPTVTRLLSQSEQCV